MAGAAVALSFGLVKIDASLGDEGVRRLGWLYGFGPEGARAVLSAVAGSMITVAGLTFSITMLTLQLASSQFGPRLLRSFMRDRGNQVVLGTFTSTFLYCLLVLRTVRGTEGSSFVPDLSVGVGVLLATLSLAVLIYFIHHVATAIRIETVLAALAAEARDAVDRLYPEQLGRNAPAGSAEPTPPSIPRTFDHRSLPIRAKESGYLQRLDEVALMRAAREHDLLLRVEVRPGRFVTEGDALVSAVACDRITDRAREMLRDAFIVGPDRTSHQDLEHALRQVVEIAQRALSPGINDPTTALYCIDRLGEVLGHLAGRDLPSPARADESGRLRIVTEVCTFEDLACPALAAVARYALSDADVVRRLLDVIHLVGRQATPAARIALAALGESVHERSQGQLCLEFDKQTVSLALPAGGPDRNAPRPAPAFPDGSAITETHRARRKSPKA